MSSTAVEIARGDGSPRYEELRREGSGTPSTVIEEAQHVS
jgi:hypothetical protein